MRGSSHNDAPLAFWSQPNELVLARMVEILRSFRPHVVVTYDPFGGTGHPDHIQTHRVTLVATEAAADTYAFVSEGAPWTVGQAFYPVFPVSAMEQLIEEDLRAGRPHPFDERPAMEINYVRPDALVTHRLGIRAVYERKRDALHAHRTQVGPHYPQLYRARLGAPRVRALSAGSRPAGQRGFQRSVRAGRLVTAPERALRLMFVVPSAQRTGGGDVWLEQLLPQLCGAGTTISVAFEQDG